jgi:hypothetical protein
MARPVKKKSSKRRRTGDRTLPLTKMNYILLLVGVGLIIVGYLFMLEGSVDGVLPIVLAPLFLIIGYCVVIPIALLYRQKEEIPGKSDPSA